MSKHERTRTTTINKTLIDSNEKSKCKIPILSERDTGLTKVNPKMWWEQIQEYTILTYQLEIEEVARPQEGDSDEIRNLREKIKGDITWTLGPKAKHNLMRGQWGREFRDISHDKIIVLFKKTFVPARNVFHSRAQFFN